MQLFSLPMRSHDSRAGVGVRSQQEMSQFVGHHISQNVRKADVPIGVQFRRPVIKNIAVTAGAFIRQEGDPDDFTG